MRKLYLCVGCLQIHYDNDFCENDGDFEIPDGKLKKKYIKYVIKQKEAETKNG